MKKNCEKRKVESEKWRLHHIACSLRSSGGYSLNVFYRSGGGESEYPPFMKDGPVSTRGATTKYALESTEGDLQIPHCSRDLNTQRLAKFSAFSSKLFENFCQILTSSIRHFG